MSVLALKLLFSIMKRGVARRTWEVGEEPHEGSKSEVVLCLSVISCCSNLDT